MARKAASKTKGRTPRQITAPNPVATQTTDAPRRGRKPKQREEQPAELALADLFLPGAVEPGSETSAETDSIQPAAMPPMEHDKPRAESKLSGFTTDDAGDATQDAVRVKARRGRRPKAQLEIGSAADAITDAGMPMMDTPTEGTESVVSAEQPSDARTDEAAKTPSAKLHRGRARKSETSPQTPENHPEQGNDESPANLPDVDQAEAEVLATVGSAVHWDHRTDTVTFDWPAIEQAAAADRLNRGMAKLLLAAHAEGANSRWPF